jgi:fructuronate reductase
VTPNPATQNPATAPTVRRLTRERDGRPAAPVRIAHLGTGAFFRAHQAWYTEHAPDASQWGIAAFSGRAFSGHGGRTAEALAGQDGLYTLIVRAADGDQPETVSALSEVSGSLDDWRRCFARPELALVTITVTEAGYRRTGDGGLDAADPEVAADVAALRAAAAELDEGVDGDGAEVVTAPGKLALGLALRRARDLPGLAIVSCDNVPDNGPMVARVVGELAAAVDAGLAAWIEANVSFVTTMVDRITPRTTEDDRARLRTETGVDDPVPVVTEPYVEWVLAGDFPRGRPRWEDAGARFVKDIVPWEQRKLRLLNGSHSLMAYAATIRGHDTVDQAIADPIVRAWVDQWWDDAARHLPLPADDIAAYRAALLERYANPRIRHLLAQIAADGSQKLPIRILPTVRAELAEGRVPEGAVRVLAAWVCHLRGLGAPVADVAADEFVALASGDLDDAVGRVLDRLGVDDQRVRATAAALAHELGR